MLGLEVGLAVPITILTGVRIAVVAQLILELELGIAVVARFWITVVSRFVSNWCFKHCHGETSLSLHFQEFTLGRGRIPAWGGTTVRLRIAMLRTRARPEMPGVPSTRVA